MWFRRYDRGQTTHTDMQTRSSQYSAPLLGRSNKHLAKIYKDRQDAVMRVRQDETCKLATELRLENKLPSIEDRGQTDRVAVVANPNPDPRRAMVIHRHAENHDQRTSWFDSKRGLNVPLDTK